MTSSTPASDPTLAHLASALIDQAARRAFNPALPGRPPPSLMIQGANPAHGALLARRALSALAIGRGVSLVENTAVSPLGPEQADAMEIFCSSIMEPGSDAMRAHIKERLLAAKGSAGLFILLHNLDQASAKGRELLRDLFAESRFDGQDAACPLFLVGSSSEPLELSEPHDATWAQLDPALPISEPRSPRRRGLRAPC